MVCYIKYRASQPIPEIENTIEQGVSCRSSRTTIRSLKSVTAKTLSAKSKIIDEPKTLLVNSDCYAQILIDYVCSEAGIDKESVFDFCDTTGQLIGIHQLKQWDNVRTIMPPDKIYYIVPIFRNALGQCESFEILLNKGTELYTELFKKLKKQLVSNFSKDRIQIRSSSKSTPRMSHFDKSQTRRRSAGSVASKSQVIV